MTSARRTRLYASLLLLVASAPPATALPPVPYNEIVDTVRALAAELLERKPEEVNTATSLFSQGLTEKKFIALTVAIQDEFGVVIPDDALHRAKHNDTITGVSVRRLADMVYKHMQEQR